MAHLLLLAIKSSIFLSMLGLGLQSTWAEATWLFRHPALLLRAVVAMSVVVPIAAVAVSMLTGLPREVDAALLASAVSPVPPILYAKQLKSGGRREYVVGLLVAMSALAIVTVPISVAIFAHALGLAAFVQPIAIARIMLATVLLPLGLGIALRRVPILERAAAPMLSVAGLLLTVGVLGLLFGLRATIASFASGPILLALAFVAAVALAVGHLLGGPSAADRTVLATSAAARHPAVAVVVATSGTLATEPEIAIVLLYLLVATAVSWPYLRLRTRATQR
jgi:BASS family bile acid:Na+ symporter